MLPAHEQHGRVARGSVTLATAAFATTMRAWIGLLNVSERVNLARGRKVCVPGRADSAVHGVRERVTVTVTGLEPREG
jgi:hypothetical protein